MEVVLRDIAYGDRAVATMIAELQQEYVVRYGGPDDTLLLREQFEPPHGVFIVAYAADEAIGCGGLRRHDSEVVEIKRMYVRTPHRRRGHARNLLRALEERARAMGYRRVILETGTAQPEALHLYASEGYTPIASFGRYRDAPGNRCFGKDL
jgi:GNAT superfamily N-acetyltransferase